MKTISNHFFAKTKHCNINCLCESTRFRIQLNPKCNPRANLILVQNEAEASS